MLDCRECEPTRQRDAWAGWIAGLRPWDLFGGLTFDQRRRGEVRLPAARRPGRLHVSPRLTEDGSVRLGDQALSADVARARVRRWLRDGEERLGRQLAAVVALEYQRNGWPHFHPLIGVAGGLLSGDEITELKGLWFQRNGYARLEVPRSAGDVAAYASKYLVKDLARGDVLFWPARGGLGSLVGQVRMPELGRFAAGQPQCAHVVTEP